MGKNESSPPPEAFGCSCEIEVRFRDLDAMGHVNNAAYLTYFEIARTHLMTELGRCDAASAPEDVFPFILLWISCRFLAPVSLGQGIVAHIRTSHIGGKSFGFQYLLTDRDSGHPVAAGESTQVCYDYAAGRTVPVPAGLRADLERYLGPALPGG